MPYNANDIENEILKHWDKTDVFKKSVEQRPADKPYVFYDGPPFATGLPHYGHIVAGLMKDVVPRYWTMQGYRVERRWGWDCHGLPVENILEKELDLNTKQDIENYGIDKFNESCRATVLKYAEEWKKTVRRMGRWVDMEHAYHTMDVSFMESVWWVFKKLWEQNLIYEGKKAMHICPRCVTPLSNFEVTQGYKDIKDLSATAMFKILDTDFKQQHAIESDLYILAWTTTPWTLPGNVLLAVGEDIEYVIVKGEGSYYICAKERVGEVFKQKEKEDHQVVASLYGKDLLGLSYEPLFPYFADTKNAFKVVDADFVTTDDGTGIVHIAPAFGEDDYNLGHKHEVDWVQHVTMQGRFVDEVTDFAGQDVKQKDDHTATDIEIIKWLAHQGKLFSKEKYEHSYPHCWRCDTPLLNYATSSWFVKVTHLKDDLLKNNAQTRWVPEHIKDGRFGLWLEGARDWAISRNRYWGTPLPVWRSEDGDILCVGSVSELETLSGVDIADLHKHFVDEIVIKKDGKEYRRIPEVLDCWFESGSMPYGQMHYPFENKEQFEAGFPAEFIAEGQDQTRGWFYTLHVLATALTRGGNPVIPKTASCPAFRNVIVNGIVLAEDGKKMSKRLKNYPDPNELLETYGADAMRFYLVNSPVMHAENLNFSEAGVREMYSKVVNTLWNVLTFYTMFDEGKNTQENLDSNNVLDKWILAKLHILIRDVTENMNEYKLAPASRSILDFVTELSQWYVRRSRDRFKGEDEADKQQALSTLHVVLLSLSKVMAPFTPFIAEKIYQELGGELESVHLEMWPEVEGTRNKEQGTILEDMEIVRKIVELGLSVRSQAGIKVRQPLQYIRYQAEKLSEDLEHIIVEEINVKEVKHTETIHEQDGRIVKEDAGIRVGLNIEMTDDLKKEGLLREVVRAVNQMRKDMTLTIDDVITLQYKTDSEVLKGVFEDFTLELKQSVLADDVFEGGDGQEIKIDEYIVFLQIIKK